MASYDIGIIGGGPGGYVAALRASQLGLRTALFERDRVGGVCLNWGCIPSKALLKNAEVVNLVREAEAWGIRAENVSFDLGAAVDRSRSVVEKIVSGVEGLLKDANVDVVQGSAALGGPRVVTCGGVRHEVKNIVIASGTNSRNLPGLVPDGRVVLSSKDAVVLRKVPKHAVVIGAGPVGVEFGHLWASYGSKVTIVELLDAIVPLEDSDVSRALRRSFEARGIECRTGTKVESVQVSGDVARVSLTADGKEETLEADAVLIAIGFVPHTQALNLESANVQTQRGFIGIDDKMRTNVPGVYAIGDVTGKLPLAHVASQQGVIAAEVIAGRQTPVLDYVQMPRATFSEPQVGSIGYTEKQAKEAGYSVKTGRFPLTALGRAVAVAETEGFVKVVADGPTGQVLGIHMIGHGVNDLLGEASMVSLLEATTVELGFAVHAHPTLPEALKEAALAVTGEAIHIAHRRAGRPSPSEGVSAR